MTACAIPGLQVPAAQLDRAAVLLAYALPSPLHCECRQSPCTCRSASGATTIRCDLHRLESSATIGEAGRLRVSQQVGRHAAGRWRSRITFFTSAPPHLHQSDAVPFDNSQPRFAALRGCEFDFGNDWCFEGEARGETWPILRDGEPVLYLVAAGWMRRQRHHEETMAGAFAVCGPLSASGDFAGIVSCRIPDGEGRILRGRDVLSLEAMRSPDPESAFVVLRGLSESAEARTASGQVKLRLGAGLRSAEYLFAAERESLPLHAAVVLGRPIGQSEACIMLERGESGNPGSLKGEYRYRLQDGAGRTRGTATASVAWGSAHGFELAGAREANAFCYAAVGAINETSGDLEGLHGFAAVTGSASTSPAAAAETVMLLIFDPGRRLHDAAPAASPAAGRRPGRERFLPLVERLDALAPMHREWRAVFRGHAHTIAETVAAGYNSVRRLGDFEGLEMRGISLREAFEAPVAPFHRESFERYRGRALGSFKFYSQETGGVIRQIDTYSFWDPATYRFGKQRCKFVTGSLAGFAPPWEASDFAAQQIDAIVNSHRDDIGLVSYIRTHQGQAEGGFRERVAMGYEMPGRSDVIWIVRELTPDGTPAAPDEFMTSHEWTDCRDGVNHYLMVGMFWRLDPATGEVRQAGDTIWRALYIEIPDKETVDEERRYVE